jgi:Tfp pilus assembly protein PilV
MIFPSARHEEGNTLPELMISALILGVFFASIFEVSAVCLRYISSSKENLSAIECVQDRIEQLRALDFPSLTDPTFLAVVPATPAASPAPSPPQRRNLTVPSNASDLATQATEEVTISTYSGGAATSPSVKYTRAPGAKINTAVNFADTNVTPSIVWTGGASLSAATTVQVDVKYTWYATLGHRTRTETSSTILAAGTKK